MAFCILANPDEPISSS